MSLKGCLFAIIKYSALFVSLMVVGALSTLITLQFFASGDEVTVPDLRGKDAMEAIRILNQEGLQLKILKQKRYSDEIGRDRIVLQDPRAGVQIKQGRSISVYLSLGPEKIIVPELAGQSARVATLMLQQQGLETGKVIYVNLPQAAPDAVLAQDPAAGTELAKTRLVNVVVNGFQTSASYVMPDVIGKPYTVVSSYFREAGLRVGLSQAVDYPGIAPGRIVKQAPPAGYKVSKDTFISLYYSK